jgi:phage shock protein C
VVGGVCGGLAEYFGVDPVLIRIAAVALALSGGAGVLAYVIAWIVIPEDGTPAGQPASSARRPASSTAGTTVVGAVLVALGGLLLVNRIWPWVNAAVVWPLILVVLGVAVLTSGRRRS